MNLEREILRTARLVLSLDCKKFEKDYSQLLRKYHTMHGPSKRQIRRTLDVMERRIRRECEREDEGEEEESDKIRFVNKRGFHPDLLWKGSELGYTFIYFPRTGQILKGDVGTTHTKLLFKNLKKISPRAFNKKNLWKMVEAIEGEKDQKVRRTNAFFNHPDRITKNWDDFTDNLNALGATFSYNVILWPGVYDLKNMSSGRTGMINGDFGATFWGKPRKSMMVKALKKLGDERVDLVWVWE